MPGAELGSRAVPHKLAGGTLLVPILQMEKRTPRRRELARRPRSKSAPLRAVSGAGPRTRKNYPQERCLDTNQKVFRLSHLGPHKMRFIQRSCHSTLHWNTGVTSPPQACFPTGVHCSVRAAQEHGPEALESQSSLPVLYVGPAGALSLKHPLRPFSCILPHPQPWPVARGP